MEEITIEQTFWQRYRPWIIGGSILGTTLLAIAVAYQARKHKQNKVVQQQKSQPSRQIPYPPKVAAPVKKPPVSKFRCKKEVFPLEYRSCGPEVAFFQTVLKHYGADLGTYGPNRDGIDGKFGNTTKAAAMAKLGKTSFSSAEIDRFRSILRFVKA